jgi:hypothetical protein
MVPERFLHARFPAAHHRVELAVEQSRVRGRAAGVHNHRVAHEGDVAVARATDQLVILPPAALAIMSPISTRRRVVSSSRGSHTKANRMAAQRRAHETKGGARSVGQRHGGEHQVADAICGRD